MVIVIISDLPWKLKQMATHCYWGVNKQIITKKTGKDIISAQ